MHLFEEACCLKTVACIIKLCQNNKKCCPLETCRVELEWDQATESTSEPEVNLAIGFIYL